MGRTVEVGAGMTVLIGDNLENGGVGVLTKVLVGVILGARFRRDSV